MPNRSIIIDSFFKKTYPNKATYTGAVYCNKIAFPTVLNLLASTNKVTTYL